MLCLLLALFVLPAPSTPAQTLLPGFLAEPVVPTSWSQVAGIKFGPNGRLFVWQRWGTVFTVENGQRSAPVIDIVEEVGAWYDYGLIGFALHPNWYENGYIYLSYVVDRHHLMECNEPASGSGPAECSQDYSASNSEYFAATTGRVTRYTLVKPQGDPDYRNATTVDYNSRKVLVGRTLDDGCPSLHFSHGIGEVLFGTDGSLIVACGDGASGNAVDVGGTGYAIQAIVDGIIDANQNVGAFRSQLLESHNGKLLRIDPETGDGLSTNPFYDPAEPRSARSRVWTLGLRNPFRIHLRPGTGSHFIADGDPGVMYLGDVGWNSFEELDVVDAGGLNFGWPVYEGLDYSANAYPSTRVQNPFEPNPLFGQPGCNASSDEFFAFQDLLIDDTLDPNADWPNPCDAQTSIPPTANRFIHRRPKLEWKHEDPNSPRWSTYDGNNPVNVDLNAAAPGGDVVSGPLFPGNASVGGIWYPGGQYPSSYDNTYFHGDFGEGWVKLMRFDANDELERAPVVAIEDFIDDGNAIVDLAFNPADGMLYFVDWPSTVYRVRHVGDGNFPPNALASASATYGPSPLTVNFSSAGTTDPEDDPLTYLWDFGDGNQSTDPNPVHTFDPGGNVTGPAMYGVSLTVTDDDAESDGDSITISINNTPPSVSITSPPDLALYSMTSSTLYNLTASINDLEHSGGELTCSWTTYLHHNFHNHTTSVDDNCSTSVVIEPVGCNGESYFYRIVLEVSDAHGLVGTDDVSVFPDCGGTNAPPVALDDQLIGLTGDSVVLDVLANDTDDVAIDPATVNIVTPPTSGSITNIDTVTGEVTYTHDGSLNTTDAFNYTVSDFESLSSNLATVTLNIVPGDDTDPPTVPANVRAMLTGTSAATVRWDASIDVGGAGVAGYRVFRDSVEIGTTSALEYVDASAALATTYAYTVTAYDYLDNESLPSPAHPVTTAQLDGLELRINAGSDIVFNDTLGNAWMADQGFNLGSQLQTGTPITGTAEDGLYQSARADDSSLAPELVYSLPLASAQYVVNLYFAEIDPAVTAAGQRTFDVSIEGAVVLAGLDLYANVGSYTATQHSFDVTVLDGQLDIELASVVGTGVVAGIEVIQTSELMPSVRFVAPSEGENVDGPDVEVNYSISGSAADYDAVAFVLNGGSPVEDPDLDGRIDFNGLAAGAHTLSAQLVDVSDQPLPNVESGHVVSFTVVIPDTDPPSVPDNLSGSPSGADGASLVWDPSTDNGGSGVAGYNVYRDGSQVATTAATSYDDSGLAPDTSYSYTVSAVDVEGNESAQSAAVDVLTPPPPPGISITSPLDGANIIGPDVSVNYAVAGTGYDHVHVVVDGGTAFEEPVADGDYLIQGLSVGAHEIVLQLVDAAHVVLPNPEATSLINISVSAPDTDAPPVPTGLTVTALSTSSLQVDFDDVVDTGGSGLAGYKVFRDGSLIASPVASEFTDTGLSADTSYSYTVSAFDNAGNESAESSAEQGTTLPVPIWTGTDIGAVAAAGSHMESAVLTVTGSGRDIWYTQDEFYYVYQSLIGDGEITALVSSQTNSHPWAKAGVMIRESLNATSPHASTFLTPENGALFLRRIGESVHAQESYHPTVAAPYWVRLVRSGDTFTGYVSPDGVAWTQIDSISISMASNALVGLAVSSVNDGTYSTATFENIDLAYVDATAPAVPADLAATAIGQDTVTIEWSPSADEGGSGLAGYRVYRDNVLVGDVATTSFTDAALNPDTTYMYEVAAYDVAGNESARSASMNVTTEAAPDVDGDGVSDALDNCTLVPNASQIDADSDGYGNICDADYNNDGIVNALDLGVLKQVFFSADAVVDLNSDGIVNAVDLGIFKTLFFSPPGPSGLAD